MRVRGWALQEEHLEVNRSNISVPRTPCKEVQKSAVYYNYNATCVHQPPYLSMRMIAGMFLQD